MVSSVQNNLISRFGERRLFRVHLLVSSLGVSYDKGEGTIAALYRAFAPVTVSKKRYQPVWVKVEDSD
jgi:hypothetical protein